MTTADRRAVLARILEDPPTVHALAGEGTDGPMGIWATDVDLYELIADVTERGSRTLETGLGLSTALFVALGAEHTCAAWGQEECDRLVAWCASRGHPTDRLTLAVGDSTATLPGLAPTELDVVLIDGGHGFPTPSIDFHYGAQRLRVGGTLIVDDAPLYAVRQLLDVLDADPRWERTHRTRKWVAYRRRAAGEGPEDWWAQPWLRPSRRFQLTQRWGFLRQRLGRRARRLGLRRGA
jgi:hypothetical protein